MSKIQPQKFTVEEFQSQSTWIDKLFSPLNQFTGSLVEAFNNQLTVSDNLYQEIKEIKYVNTSTNFPLVFRTKFAAYPRGLLPIYLQNTTLGSYSTLTPWVVWSYANNQITISSISGLTSGSSYTIRLLVIYG